MPFYRDPGYYKGDGGGGYFGNSRQVQEQMAKEAYVTERALQRKLAQGEAAAREPAMRMAGDKTRNKEQEVLKLLEKAGGFSETARNNLIAEARKIAIAEELIQKALGM